METPDILHQAEIGGLSEKENIERASLAFTAWAGDVAGGGQLTEKVIPERTRPKM